jgi:uncharacterized protein with HEPN domain
MSERDRDFLSDILEAIRRIELYLSDSSYEIFLKDIKTEDAIVRNLEIIGEAAKKLSEELRNDYPQLPWKKMAGLRDRLIHHYFGVNYDVVWAVAKKELPKIKPEIEKIVNG